MDREGLQILCEDADRCRSTATVVNYVNGEAQESTVSEKGPLFLQYLRRTENTICGRHPISLYMFIAQYEEQNATQLFYERNEEVRDPRGSSVSYASAAWYRV